MDQCREEGDAMSAKAKRILALLNDPKYRGILLDKINKDNAPEGSPISGGSHEMTILKDMNTMCGKIGFFKLRQPSRNMIEILLNSLPA